jgi:hypothetical protein
LEKIIFCATLKNLKNAINLYPITVEIHISAFWKGFEPRNFLKNSEIELDER